MRMVGNDMKPDRDEEAAAWYLDLSAGELPLARRAELDEWMEDPENHEAFRRAAEIWDVTEAIASSPEVVHMRAEALASYREAAAPRLRKPANIGGRIAGMIAVASAAAAAVAFWLTTPNTEAYRTGIGETQVAMLEDGSRLSLDADSSVDTTFDSQRRALVLNRGRARFDVAHNPVRPFTVAVGDKVVVATGTSFSVEKLGSEVHVVLYQGQVTVVLGRDWGLGDAAIHKGGMEELLEPGHELTLPAIGEGAAAISKAPNLPDWGQGRVSFDDEPLVLAVERMNRYLPEPLVVADRGAAAVKVTGVFDTSSSTGFVEALRHLSGVRAERRDGKVQLSKP